MSRLNWEKANRQERVYSAGPNKEYIPKKKSKKKKSYIRMRSKFPSICSSCRKSIGKNVWIKYYKKDNLAIHTHCKR